MINNGPGRIPYFRALPFLMKNGTLAKENGMRNSCHEEKSDYRIAGDNIFG